MVAVALLTQTWLWMGVTGAPIGYTFEKGPSSYGQFLVSGGAGELGPAGTVSISAGPRHFEQDWSLINEGGVHISEDVEPLSILLGGQPSYDEIIAAIHTRTTWQETTALGGRVNALKATIGRTTVSIAAPLSYNDVFRIAESLRPRLGPLL